MGVSSFGIVVLSVVAVLLSSPCPCAAARKHKHHGRHHGHQNHGQHHDQHHEQHAPSKSDKSPSKVEIPHPPPQKPSQVDMDGGKHQSKGKKSKSKAGKSGGRTKSGKSSSKVAKQKSNEEKSKSKAFKSAKQQSKEETSKSKAFKSGGPGAAKAGKPNSDTTSSTGQASDMDDGIGSAAGVSSAPTPKATNSPTNDPNERMNTPRPSSARPTPNPTPVPSPAVVLARANIPPPGPAPKPILVDVENYPLLVETLRPTLPGALRSSPGTASVLSDGEAGGGTLGVGAMVGIIISALAVVGAAGLVLASRHEGGPRQEAATVGETATQPDLETETDHVDEGGGGA